MAERGPYFATRLVAAGVALAVALAITFALGAFWHLGGKPLQLQDVLIGPFVYIFWVAPPLFVIGMASRSKNALSASLSLALAVLMGAGLQLFQGLPWHYAHWHDQLGDSSLTLSVVVFFAFWPLAATGALLWLALNRR